jgi:hypothetical protein
MSINILTPPTTQTPRGIRLSTVNLESICNSCSENSGLTAYRIGYDGLKNLRKNNEPIKKPALRLAFLSLERRLVFITLTQEENTQRNGKQHGEHQAINKDHR